MSRQFSRIAARIAVCAAVGFSIPGAFAEVIGVSEVPLNGVSFDVRSIETNLGNLITDAYRWQAEEAGLTPTIGIINGGNIRASAAAGATPAAPVDIDDVAIANILPPVFGNDLVVIDDVTVDDLLAALENSVFLAAAMPAPRFLQVSGLRFSWSTTAAPGSRIIDVVLDDGTVLVNDGSIVSSLLVDIATSTFIAGGGDFYSMFTGYTANASGFSDFEALTNFIATGLSGRVRAADYPVGVNERIFRDANLVPEPATSLLVALALAGLGWTRSRVRRPDRV